LRPQSKISISINSAEGRLYFREFSFKHEELFSKHIKGNLVSNVEQIIFRNIYKVLKLILMKKGDTMKQKTLLILILFCLFSIPILVNAQTSCEDYCEEGIYYYDGEYDQRTLKCDYSTERCESGCNTRGTECAVTESVLEDKTCDPYCEEGVYYGRGSYNREIGECEYQYRDRCGEGCNTRGTECYQSEAIEMSCPDYCSDDTYFYGGSYDEEARRCRYRGRGVCRYGCDLRQDNCAEPGQVIEYVESIEKTCRDSDGGRDFEEKGKVLWVYGDEEGTLQDHCVGGSTLVEYYCDNNVRSAAYKECSDDEMLCKDAKCVKLVKGDCIDSDGDDVTTKAWADGTNVWNEGLVSWGDYCSETLDGGSTETGDYVHEAICLETADDYYEVRYAEVQKCKDGCEDGICIGNGKTESVEEVKEETTTCSSGCACMTREAGAEKFSQLEMCSNNPCDYASDGTAMYCIKGGIEKAITRRRISASSKNELGIEEKENEYLLKRADRSYEVRNPEEAISQYVKSNEEFESINVTLKEDKPIYEIRTRRKARLLGVIPINLRIRFRVNADDLTLIEEERPWWSFLAREISEDFACLPPDCIDLEENGIMVKKGNQAFLIRKNIALPCIPPSCTEIRNTGVIAEIQDISDDSHCLPPDCIDLEDNQNMILQKQGGKMILQKLSEDSHCFPPDCIDLEEELGSLI